MGFLKVYLEGTDEEGEEDQTQEGMLPAFNKGDVVLMNEIISTQRFTKHPARYQEASLVKKLEELGIGRPSTYAPTISTIQKRGYVVKEDREGVERKFKVLKLNGNTITEDLETERTGTEKNKLFPTDTGIVVTDFLADHFKNIMDYSFTADVEKQFDDIADGQLQWNKMIENFYNPFHKNVEHTLENADRAKGERNLGTDPESGKPVFARIGRYGAMVQIGSVEDEEKPKFASLLRDQSIETITFEEAMELFRLPRDIGEYEGKAVTAAIGRFGPYVKWNSLFVSLKKNDGDDPFTVDLPRAIELIEIKKEQERNKYIKVFEEDKNIQVLNGRWGPYIKFGKKNVKIPKDVKPEELTLEDCKRIANEAPAKKKAPRKTKKAK